MTVNHPNDHLSGPGLVRELCKLPQETEWVEFKENNANPGKIGEYISALANSAVLESEASAYLVWGIRDRDHAVVGTTFKPHKTKVGNEQLENWLLRLLEPKIDFHFYTIGSRYQTGCFTEN